MYDARLYLYTKFGYKFKKKSTWSEGFDSNSYDVSFSSGGASVSKHYSVEEHKNYVCKRKKSFYTNYERMKKLEMEAHKVYSDFYRMSGREQRKHYRGYKKEINRIANIEECGLKLCKEKEIHSNDVGFLKYLIIIYVLTMLVAIIYAIILSL